jgi:peptidoglycan/LPS O-acetylase OafA/YrhL
MIVPNLLMVQAWWPGSVISFNYVSWSISAEFFVYLLYPLLMIAFGGPMWRALALVAVTLAAAAAIAEWGMGLSLTKLSWNFGILRALPGFAFGVWLCSHAPRLSAIIPPARARQALCVLLVAVGVLMVWRQSQLLTLIVIWAMVAVAYLCDRAQLSTWVSVRWLSVNGRLTYSIYMLHTVIATLLLTFLFPRLIGTGETARAVSVLLALPVLYLASFASLRWFEDPLRAAIGRVGDRRFGRTAPRSFPVQFQ